MASKKPRKRRRLLKLLVVGGGIAAVAYAVAMRQKPGPSVPAGGPQERVLLKDEENLSGLGNIMQMMITQTLENPQKARILDGLNLIFAIQPIEDPEMAITITFSDGYVVLEPGVVPSPDVLLVCDMDVLMKMAAMGSGMDALRYLSTAEGKELVQKFMSGELKVRGMIAHPISMYRFTKFLAPESGSAG